MRVLLCIICSCLLYVNQAAGEPYKSYPRVNPQWPGPVHRINLVQDAPWIITCGADLEFSHDSLMICVYNHIGGESHSIVYDMEGRIIGNAVTTDGFLSSDFQHRFKRAAAEASNQIESTGYVSHRQLYESLLNHKQYPELLNKASSWRFNEKGDECLILAGQDWSLIGGTNTLELWNLVTPPKLLWSVPVALSTREWRECNYFKQDGQDRILIADWKKFVILAHEDGRVIQEVFYGDKLSSEQLDARVKLVDPKRLIPRMEIDFLKFNAFVAEMSPELLFYAAGETNGRRVRVFSIKPPYQKIIELNETDCPYWPKGAYWTTERINFSGKLYMLVQYNYARASLFGGVRYSPTDVYETRTWKLVWHENDENIGTVAISRDGRKMGLIRGNTLEIGEFRPMTN